MLDIKLVSRDPDHVKKALRNRGYGIDAVTQVLNLNEERTEKIRAAEALKHLRNEKSKEIAILKRQGKAAKELLSEMGKVSQQIKDLDEMVSRLEGEIKNILLVLPNIPHVSVPIGADASFNREERRWGEITHFSFEPLSHEEIGTRLGILDFATAARITGARFVLYKGKGAKLERTLIQFMLDIHTKKHEYVEVLTPFLANEDALMGTGNLPKFKGDLFKIEGWPYYLIPTAEVSVTNIHREEILEDADLPISYVAYSPCFRSEAGSYGKDTKGLIRLHQFNKVELVKFTRPEESYSELEKLTGQVEKILQLLGLPYRVVTLCTGDMGFSAAKTYDIEVWLPSLSLYKEISSCSNFEAFQARRAQIKYRRRDNNHVEYVHTLNGSGLAIGRTVVAILENYQQPDGSVIVPEALRDYMECERL